MQQQTATLDDVAKTMSDRQLVAYVIREVRLQLGWQQQKVASEANVSPSLLARINRGDERVSRISLRYIEVALELPDHLLWFIASGDTKGVESVPADKWPDVRLREMVLTEMGVPARPNRRRTDRAVSE